MNPAFNAYLADTLIQDRVRRAAERSRFEPEPSPDPEPYLAVTVRRSRPADRPAVSRLAQMEGRRLPAEPLLVAEVCGKVLAARSLGSRQAVADPSRPTGQLLELLDLRSLHLREQGGRPARRRGLSRLLHSAGCAHSRDSTRWTPTRGDVGHRYALVASLISKPARQAAGPRPPSSAAATSRSARLGKSLGGAASVWARVRGG